MGGGMDGTEHWVRFDGEGEPVTVERLTPERLAELRLITEAATKGPWAVNPCKAVVDEMATLTPMCAMLWPTDLRTEEQTLANARHIATFDPTTTLALLDEIERLQHEVMHLRDFLAESEALASHLRQRYEALRSAVEGVAERIGEAADYSYGEWRKTASDYLQGRAHAMEHAERMVRRILSDGCPYCGAPMEDDPGRYPSGDVETIWTCGTWVDGDGQRHQHEHCASQEVPGDV